MTTQTKGILIALFCVTIWASIAAVIRLTQDTLDHYQLLFWASFFSLVAVAIASAFKGTLLVPLKYKKMDWFVSIVIGFIGTFFNYLLLYRGLSEGKGMNVTIIQYTWPLMLSLLSIAFFKETLNWRKVFATSLGICAVVVVLSKGQVTKFTVEDPKLLGDVALGALCFACFNLGMKHLKLEPTSLFVVFFSVATICSFMTMLIKSTFILPKGRDLFAVIYLGALVNGLSDLIWLWALRKTQASFLAPFIYFAPVLAMMYLVIFFHEPFYPAYALGLVLIVSSGLLSSSIKISVNKRQKAQAV